MTLELLAQNHAEGLYQLAAANKQHLSTWLTWVDQMNAPADFSHFIRMANDRCEKKEEVPFVIVVKDQVAGRIRLNQIDLQNKIAAIGYWPGACFEGQGIVTEACRLLVRYTFTATDINRLEIKCGTGNHRSTAVAERLGFVKEGVARQSERINGKWIDLNVYAPLKQDWIRHG